MFKNKKEIQDKERYEDEESKARREFEKMFFISAVAQTILFLLGLFVIFLAVLDFYG